MEQDGTEVGSSKQRRATASLLLQIYRTYPHGRDSIRCHNPLNNPLNPCQGTLAYTCSRTSAIKMGLPEKIETRLFINGEVGSLKSIDYASANYFIVR